MAIGLLKELMLLIVYHPYLVSFFGAFFSEEFIIFLAIFSGRGILDFWIVFISSILGVFVIDSIYFWVGKSKLGRYFYKILPRLFFEEEEEIVFVHKRRHLAYICFSKFVYGTRILTILYYSIKGMDYSRFIIYDMVAISIWSIILLPMGWLAGKGFGRLLKVATGFEKLLLIVLILFVISFVVHLMINRILNKMKNS